MKRLMSSLSTISLLGGLLLSLTGAPQAAAAEPQAAGSPSPAAQAGTVYYVDGGATGANDGSNWTDAFNDLQDALAAAVDGAEIWVAEGAYLPTDVTDRYSSFHLVSGVAVYGGFDPTDGAVGWGDRDWDANPTVLSGDIGTPGGNSDNSYHVVTAGSLVPETTVLDGFIITGGNANLGSAPWEWGGGMYVEGNPTIRNTTFISNTARGGGRMFIKTA